MFDYDTIHADTAAAAQLLSNDPFAALLAVLRIPREHGFSRDSDERSRIQNEALEALKRDGWHVRPMMGWIQHDDGRVLDLDGSLYDTVDDAARARCEQ
jgi:hypothetical protein